MAETGLVDRECEGWMDYLRRKREHGWHGTFFFLSGFKLLLLLFVINTVWLVEWNWPGWHHVDILCSILFFSSLWFHTVRSGQVEGGGVTCDAARRDETRRDALQTRGKGGGWHWSWGLEGPCLCHVAWKLQFWLSPCLSGPALPLPCLGSLSGASFLRIWH